VSAQPPPGIRISDADRERAAGRLQQALTEGRITFDELEERLAAVYAARYAADLLPPFADLPGGTGLPITPAAPVRPTARSCCAAAWARCAARARGRCRAGSGCRA
jgi:hypothetical protein